MHVYMRERERAKYQSITLYTAGVPITMLSVQLIRT